MPPRRHLAHAARGPGEGDATQRRSAPVFRLVAPRGIDARLHPRPARGRQRRTRRPARLLRPGRRTAASRPRIDSAGLSRDPRAAERRAAPRAVRALRPRCARAVDRADGGVGRRAGRRPSHGARAARAALRRTRRTSSASRTRDSATRPSHRRVPTSGALGAGPRTRDDRTRPASRRRDDRERRPRPPPVRLAGRAASCGALASSCRGRAPRSRHRSCSSTTCSPSSIPGVVRCWQSGSRDGTDDDHDDACVLAAGRAGAGRGGGAWNGSVAIFGRSSRASGRSRACRSCSTAGRRPSALGSSASRGPRGSRAMAPCTSTRPIRSGPSSSLSARRRSPSGSAWRSSALPPGRCRRPRRERVHTPLTPTPEDEEAARALAAGIADETLRESVQKAVSLGLAQERRDHPI